MTDNLLPVSASTIGYIILAVVLFILIVSVLVGLKRGAKKALFRLLWVGATAVILFFTTPLLSSYLNTIDLTSYGINIFGEVDKLSDIGVNFFKGMGLTDLLTNSPALLDFAENLSVIVLNLVLFILLFWLAKWILGIPYAIIASKAFDKDKRERKKYKEKIKELKKKGANIDETKEEMPILLTTSNKNGGLGMFFGLLLGMVVCVATFMPLVGLNNLYQQVYSSITTTNEEGEEVPYLSTVMDENVQAYVNCYEDSIASKIFTYSGMEYLSDLTFDKMTQVEVGGQSVSLTNELTVGLSVYKRVVKVQEVVENIDTATQEDVNEALANVNEILSTLDDSTALKVIGDELLPYAIDKYFVDDTSITFDIGGEDYAQMLREAYANYKLTNEVNVANIKEQVEAVTDIAILLNNNGLVVPIIHEEVSSPEDAIDILSQNVVNASSFSESLVNYLYQFNIIKYKYPELVDTLLDSAFDAINVDFVSNESNLDATTIKTSLQTLLTNVIEVLKSYNDSDNFDFGTQAQTVAVFGYAGKILNVCKNNLLSSQSYANLVDFLEDKVVEETTDFGDLTGIVSSIGDITNWETELKNLAPLYTVVVKIVNNNENVNGVAYDKTIDFDKILDEEYPQFYDIGNALQTVISSGNSKILTSENIRSAVSILLNKFATNDTFTAILDDMTVDGVSVRNIILNSIWNETTESSAIVNWGNEFKYTLAILRSGNTAFSNFDLAGLTASTDTRLEDFGEAIDDAIANTKLFVSNGVMRALISKLLDDEMSSFPDELENVLTDKSYYDGNVTIESVMLNNIYDSTATVKSKIVSWKTEFATLKTLFAIDFGNTDDSARYASIGTALDNIATSKLLDRSIVKKIIVHYIEVETATLDSGLVSGPVATIKNTILLDATTSSGDGVVSYQIKYGTELGYLVELVGIATDSYQATGTQTADDVKFKAIGNEFNDLINAQSKLLTQTVLNQFLAYYITSFSVADTVENYQELNDIVHDIPGDNNVNLAGITDYALEFDLLLETVTMMRNSAATLSSIGTTLNDVRLRNSHLITDSVIDRLVVLFIDSKVNSGNLAGASDIVDQIKSNVTTKTIDPASNNGGYVIMFSELSTLKDYFDSLADITGKDNVVSNMTVDNGASVQVNMLDNIRDSMTIAGDADLASVMSTFIVNKIADYVETEAQSAGKDEGYGSSLVFSSVATYNETHTATDSTYYAGLIDALVNVSGS
jgi:uncharacterized membrane protein required for colicin V production